jgi:hypothetical protein
MLFLFAAIFGGAVLLFLHVFLFIFTSGSSPGKDAAQDEFIDQTCAPNKTLINTVVTWGYFKATWRRCKNYYRLLLFPQPRAILGKIAPDAKIVNLTGEEKSLVSDYISKMPMGMPLILNMGSYT